MADHHAGVIIDDGAEDGFGRAVVGADLGAMHEIRDPEVVDVIHLEGFAHIGAIFERKPALGFNDPEKGIVVDREDPRADSDPEALHRVFARRSRDRPCI